MPDFDQQKFYSYCHHLKLLPHYPSTVLYKYVDIDTARKILGNTTLYYQCAKNFNDPFELHLGFLDTEEYNKNSFDSWLAKKNFNTGQLALLRSQMDPDVLRNITEDALSDNREKIGILCLSETNTSTLMWSHYADKHKGVCLGFSLPALTSETIQFKVSYFDKIQPIPYDLEECEEAITAKTLYWTCAKSKDWQYEKEVRVVNIKRNGILPFDKNTLCEIYFGVTTPLKEIDEITSIIKQKDYQIIKSGKMHINKNDFKLAIEYFL